MQNEQEQSNRFLQSSVDVDELLLDVLAVFTVSAVLLSICLFIVVSS